MEQYISAAKTFLQHAKEKEQKRKNSLEAGDLKGYTIEAHSLKSNGRLLGDEQLGSMAEELEMAGVRGELDVIREKECVIRRTGQPYYRGYPLAACLYRAGCRKKGDWSGHSVRRI